MADIAVGYQVMVTIVGRYFGQTTMNTYPYLVTGAGPLPLPVFDMCDDFAVALKAAGKLVETHQACCPEQWTNTQLWIQVIRPTRYRKMQYAGIGDGTFVGDSQTANVQASIERYGELTTPHDIGGVRIPISTHANAVADGFITVALLADLQNHADEMQIPYVVNGWELYPITGLVEAGFNPLRVIGTNVKDTARVLRRRTVGLGI